MYELPLTGAQKSHLRGLGQKLDPALKVGKAGLGPGFFRHLQSALKTAELVKIRFLDADREARAKLCRTIADEGRCVCVGAVGSTALFFRRRLDSNEARRIELPE